MTFQWTCTVLSSVSWRLGFFLIATTKPKPTFDLNNACCLCNWSFHLFLLKTTLRYQSILFRVLSRFYRCVSYFITLGSFGSKTELPCILVFNIFMVSWLIFTTVPDICTPYYCMNNVCGKPRLPSFFLKKLLTLFQIFCIVSFNLIYIVSLESIGAMRYHREGNQQSSWRQMKWALTE